MIEKSEVRLPPNFTSLMIAIPNVSGKLHTKMAASLLKTVGMFRDYGIDYDVIWVIGDSAVERARNNLTAIFLDHDRFSHMLMIDDDMDWDETDVLRLLGNHHDIVFAAGVKKNQKVAPEFAMTLFGRENPMCPLCDCIEVIAGGAAFMIVSKVAVQKMVDAYPELRYMSDSEPGKMISGLFNPFMGKEDKEQHEEEGRYYAEDIAFYRRWRKIGGKVYLDPKIKLGHWGSWRWSGDLMTLFSATNKSED